MDNKQIVQKIKYMCNKKNINITQLLDGAGVRKSLLYDMEKRNAKPSIEVLASIADYLDCSVDYLLGRSNQENTSCDSYTLSQDEKTLINIFRTLPPESQQNILGYLDYTASVIINNQNTAKRAARSINDQSPQTTSNQLNSADLDNISDDNSNL